MEGGLWRPEALSITDFLLSFLSFFPVSFCSYPSFLSQLSSAPIVFTFHIPMLALKSSFLLLLSCLSSSQPLFHLSCTSPLSPTLSYPSSSLSLTTPVCLSYALHLSFPCFLPNAFFSYPSSTTISPPPTPYSLLPSLSSCPTPLYCWAHYHSLQPLSPSRTTPAPSSPASYLYLSLSTLLPLPSHSIAQTFYADNFTLKSLCK